MKKIVKNKWLAIFIIVLMGCDIFELNPEDSPNALTPNKSADDLFISGSQIRLAESYFEGFTDVGMELTRMKHMFGPLYDNAYGPSDFNTVWSTAYAGILLDLKTLKANAASKDAFRQLAIAKVMEAYLLITLTDMFGDIPYTEALSGSGNLTPAITSGQEVYETARNLLNEAIDHINNAGESKVQFDASNDLFYNGNLENWRALANTLKLRMFLNLGMTNPGAARDSVVAILGKNIINTTAENFQFNWSSTNTNPDSRHPEFRTNYVTGGTDYMSNYFMDLLLTDRPTVDPRTRYYFYRQTKTNSNSTNEMDCIGSLPPSHYSPTDPYCQLTAGYWGRDHGDNGGIPPDNLLRTIWGVYPVGGRFDTNTAGRGTQTSGGRGAGISPIMLSFFVDFMRSEAALTLGTGENARMLLDRAVRGSISKVMGFPSEIGYTFTAAENTLIPSTTVVEAYVGHVLTAFDNAPTNEAKLEVVAKEYYKALYGNGFEVYNLYRRTGYPRDLQPTLENQPGNFIRSLPYPENFVNRNSAVAQKAFPSTQALVFWDNGSKNLD